MQEERIESASILINQVTDTYGLYDRLFDDSENAEYIFGLLKIKTAITEKSPNPLLFKFDIDTSESMVEFAKRDDSYTKIDYLKRTFKNMLVYLSELVESEIYIQVSTFNSEYKELIPVIRITPENHLELIQKVMDIIPTACTNIEKTFNESNVK